MTLSSSYTFLARSSAMVSLSGESSYYLLLYARAEPSSDGCTVPVGIRAPAEDQVRRAVHRVHIAADPLLPEDRVKLRKLRRRKEAGMREVVAVVGFFGEVADATLEK